MQLQYPYFNYFTSLCTHLVWQSAEILELDIPDHPYNLRLGQESVKEHPRHVHPVAANFEEENQLPAGWCRPVSLGVLARILSVLLANMHRSSTSNDPLRRQGRIVVCVGVSVVRGQLMWQVTTCKLLNKFHSLWTSSKAAAIRGVARMLHWGAQKLSALRCRRRQAGGDWGQGVSK